MTTFKLTVSRDATTLEGPVSLLTFTTDQSARVKAFVEALRGSSASEAEIQTLLSAQEHTYTFEGKQFLQEKGWCLSDNNLNRDNRFWSQHIGKEVVITGKGTDGNWDGYLAEESGSPFAGLHQDRFERLPEYLHE